MPRVNRPRVPVVSQFEIGNFSVQVGANPGLPDNQGYA
jgi:hypothetical protein